ncbi:F0F1 ATP synthase subunit delta [Actinoalloteichus sp. AHMU CJ021]|uniref:ATP synthase subunit delta n=2 Tax=Actinoalloteichus cyanogriseus TaxID=2893586 RepID=A0ABT1JNB5_ACTCY|nr:F0F1 ATP synthase subunit delta [Actinoalloteichus caeruleus]AUS79851.1 F0F1 ATP synthase subunit delta [Actinoalloteichus sp. AHMU CJ021]MCP2334020.1 ATP synthase F1 subcomplex delta subunit [Actinoalloteichus caeruleus DSM 43889]
MTTVTTLHAASRDAFAAAAERLRAELDGVTGEELAGVGEDLGAVSRLLGRESSLRRSLADAASEPAHRESLVREVLGRKIGARALNVLATVVTARWSSPRELVEGVSRLSWEAMLISAERAGRLDTVEDELFRLGRIVASQPDLDQLLSDPAGSAAGKVTLVRQLLTDRSDPVTLALVEQLVSQPGGRTAVAGLEELAAAAAKRRERSVAHVRSATVLSDAQEERLAALLSRIYSRPVAVHTEVDPTLVGGLVIQVGDEIIDGSAAGRLAALRRQLAG